MSKRENYDKALFRLVNILTKLSNNEKPTSKELAEEFNVSVRTIQRDINNRLLFFPITRNTQGQYMFIEGFSLNKTELSMEEISSLALSLDNIKNAGKLFSETTQRIFQKICNTDKFFSPYHIKPESYEYLDTDSRIANLLEKAIDEKSEVEVQLKQKTSIVQPIKIINLDGIWYLLGVDKSDHKIKVFFFSNIKSVKNLNKFFILNKEFQKVIKHINSPFFEDGNSFSIKILVKANVSHFFKLKKHIHTQDILEERANGDLIINFQVTNEEDVDNLIKSWLPDIFILEPLEYRDKVKVELKKYLEEIES